MLWILLVCCLHFSTALTLYDNAGFVSTNSYFNFANVTPVSLQSECVCLCANDAMCLIATYVGVTYRCRLYIAPIDPRMLRLTTTDERTSTLFFENKTLTGKVSRILMHVQGIHS